MMAGNEKILITKTQLNFPLKWAKTETKGLLKNLLKLKKTELQTAMEYSRIWMVHMVW